MIELAGDLFEGTYPAIAHGVNCAGIMGAGIAVGFKARFPMMYDDYRWLCANKFLNVGGFHAWRENGQNGYNLASQRLPGRCATIEFLTKALSGAMTDADSIGITEIAMPRIGCGLGGLTWTAVRASLVQLEDTHPTGIELIVVTP